MHHTRKHTQYNNHNNNNKIITTTLFIGWNARPNNWYGNSIVVSKIHTAIRYTECTPLCSMLIRLLLWLISICKWSWLYQQLGCFWYYLCDTISNILLQVSKRVTTDDATGRVHLGQILRMRLGASFHARKQPLMAWSGWCDA